MECETGPSSFDVRHRWVMGAVYELPFGKGKQVNITTPSWTALSAGGS
jgi:hypothetical protein